MATHQDQDLRVDAEDRAQRAPGGRRGTAKWAVFLLAAVAIAGAAFWWWSARQPALPAPPAPAASAPAAPHAAAPAASGPAYPLGTSQDTPMSLADIEPALRELLGARAVASLLQASDFPRRAAATLDNLGRSHAPSAAWPVQPIPGRFTVEDGPEGTVIAAANAARYAPFMQLVDAVDAKRAAALYRRMYPLLQQAYRELGFGDRYLNDRVVEVIDLLLAAPEPERAPKVRLTEVKGPIPSVRPWVRYEFVDPQLEALTAGQKIMVRVGATDERRLKRKLAELRREIVSTAPPAAPR